MFRIDFCSLHQDRLSPILFVGFYLVSRQPEDKRRSYRDKLILTTMEWQGKALKSLGK